MERLRVLVLPVFRNYWLWEALPSQRGVAAAPKALANWRTGQNLEEKAHLIGLHVSRWLQSKLNMEWQKLVQAPDGSWRNRGFRMAQAVLSREDPRESFFKALPTQPGPVEFTYPGVFRERLIRRRLRHITADGLKSHRRRLLGWSLAMLPQIPLLATPLPNITVYYTGYRIYSHWRALQGLRSLERSLTELDSRQLRALREALLAWQEGNGPLQEGSWAARLVQQDRQYLDIFDRLRLYQRQRALQRQLEAAGEAPEKAATNAATVIAHQAEEEKGMPALTFQASDRMAEILRVEERDKTPLDDHAAIQLGQAFSCPRMLEDVARARRRSMGSAFPIGI